MFLNCGKFFQWYSYQENPSGKNFGRLFARKQRACNCKGVWNINLCKILLTNRNKMPDYWKIQIIFTQCAPSWCNFSSCGDSPTMNLNSSFMRLRLPNVLDRASLAKQESNNNENKTIIFLKDTKDLMWDTFCYFTTVIGFWLVC